MKTTNLLLVILMLMQSCRSVMLKQMFKDPRVENTETISEFLRTNNFSTDNVGVLKNDSSYIITKLFKGIAFDFLVFDKNGMQMCYQGMATCKGEQFKLLIDSISKHYKYCENHQETLQTVLQEAVQLNGQPFDSSVLQQTEYYIIGYWQKFFGGKKGYNENINWMKNLATNNSKFKFLSINTDMQENWGLQPGGKAKIEFKKTKTGMSLLVTEIPYFKK